MYDTELVWCLAALDLSALISPNTSENSSLQSVSSLADLRPPESSAWPEQAGVLCRQDMATMVTITAQATARIESSPTSRMSRSMSASRSLIPTSPAGMIRSI